MTLTAGAHVAWSRALLGRIHACIARTPDTDVGVDPAPLPERRTALDARRDRVRLVRLEHDVQTTLRVRRAAPTGYFIAASTNAARTGCGCLGPDVSCG